MEVWRSILPPFLPTSTPTWHTIFVISTGQLNLHVTIVKTLVTWRYPECWFTCPHLQICTNSTLGKNRRSTLGKTFKKLVEWRDIKKSPISVYCFNKIWRVLYRGLICRRNTCDLIAIDCLGHYSYIKERTEVTINMDQFTLHPWWPYDDCD